MENKHNPIKNLYDTPIDRHIIEYPTLVDAVQLSVARRLDIEGAVDATHFGALLERRSPADTEEIITTVGGYFDEALVNFIVGSLIGRRHHETIILAESQQGIDGSLPWQAPLLARVALLQTSGVLAEVSVDVQRYCANDADPEVFAPYAQHVDHYKTQEKHVA